ncbi:MAG: HEAT repeat domain-containing protein [Myxococcota bacterium]|nr:HEAT repeat domain-containing protein [Myxococcota bacterium]
MPSLEKLLDELRWCAGFEDLGGATKAAEAIARLDSDEAVDALVRLLVVIDDVDLEDDAGDVGDEVWRTRAAVSRGLEVCGRRAIARLRPLIAGSPTERGQAALAILAKLGDPAAIPVAIDWVDRGVMSALVPLGLLAPPNAVELLTRAIDHAPAQNSGWAKRLAAHALGKIKSDAALDVLERQLADEDWFARLGAAEALCEIGGKRARKLLAHARKDIDPRVATVAGKRP